MTKTSKPVTMGVPHLVCDLCGKCDPERYTHHWISIKLCPEYHICEECIPRLAEVIDKARQNIIHT